MAEVVLTKDNFEAEVVNSDIPVLVDFWATWCGPCMMLAPIIEEIAGEAGGRFKVCKCDVDKNIELAQKFGVMVIPTLIVFKDGREVNRAQGFMEKKEVLALIG